MKKILSLFVLMAAFCMVGFAQSAPVTAKKAMLMGDNAQVKDLKTGQVLRTAKASKQVPATVNGTIQMSGNGVATPSNSNGNVLKRIKDAEPCNNELKVKEGAPTQTATQTSAKSSATPMKNMKAPENCNNVVKMNKGAATQSKSSTNLQPKSSTKKLSRTVPQNAVILEKQ